MSKTVKITLEVESGLTNSAIERSYAEQFEEHGNVSVIAFDTPDVEQEPTAGKVINTEWIDEENYLVDVLKNGKTYREIYTFESKELLLDEEDN